MTAVLLSLDRFWLWLWLMHADYCLRAAALHVVVCGDRPVATDRSGAASHLSNPVSPSDPNTDVRPSGISVVRVLRT
jgi:hypothetical protein